MALFSRYFLFKQLKQFSVLISHFIYCKYIYLSNYISPGESHPRSPKKKTHSLWGNQSQLSIEREIVPST